MAKDGVDEAEVLRRMLFEHTRRTDEVLRRSKEEAAEIAAMYEEAEREEAWLSKHWRTLDHDGKDFVIPAGWPPGHVRKPKQDAPPADEPKDAPPPDTMMHRMLKEKQSGR